MIWKAAEKNNVHTLQEFISKGVNVTGIIDDEVSMCVAIQVDIYTECGIGMHQFCPHI